MVQTIKLMAEYGGDVLWASDGANVGPIDLESLPIPSDLKEALRQWAAKYDSTLNQDYPPDSGFASVEDEKSFEFEGKRLWATLKNTLGTDWKVTYYSESESRLLT